MFSPDPSKKGCSVLKNLENDEIHQKLVHFSMVDSKYGEAGSMIGLVSGDNENAAKNHRLRVFSSDFNEMLDLGEQMPPPPQYDDGMLMAPG